MAHFYDRATGEPRHTVEMASGKIRPSTVRDARKHSWLPSVSTVMALTGDEGLQNWQKEQVIDSCWLNPFTGGDVGEWKKKIRWMADQKRENASKDGSRIHKALEDYYLGNWELECTASDLDIDIVLNVNNFLYETFGDIKWQAEKTFSYNGYGGCVDLHNTDSEGIVIDFKVQGTENVDNFRFYDKYCQQLAAYREGLRISNARCFILKISATKPGCLLLKEYDDNQLKKQLKCFYYLLDYYYTRYDLERD